MCLAVPARIEEIDGLNAVIDLEGVRRRISLLLTPDAEVGQYALVHAGFAISVIDEDEAHLAMEPWNEYRRILEEAAQDAGDREARGPSGRGPAGPKDEA